MAVRNLYRQARPFRILGWGLFAVVLLLYPADSLSNWQLCGGLALALVGGVALDVVRFCVSQLPTGSLKPRLSLDGGVRIVQLTELLLVPCVLWALMLPLPLVVGVLGALLNANVALGGARALLWSVGAIGAGATVAALGGAAIGADSVGGILAVADLSRPGGEQWWGGAVLLLVFSVALSDVGFRLTQKLDDHRSQWRDRLRVLQPFVPQDLAERSRAVVGAGSDKSGNDAPGSGEVACVPEQQRRWMTVAMIDLVEFTSRSSPLAPEVVATVLDDLLDAVVLQANRAGGTLDKFMGDGALLFFTGHSSRAIAVAAALEFAQRLLGDLNSMNARWGGFGVPEPLQLRIGIASGYGSLGQWGTREVRAYTIVGACVSLAERLQGVSLPDSMALCPVSARLLWELQERAALGVPGVPGRFAADIDDATLEFTGSEQELRGFGRMRVFRPSAKVRTLLV